MSRSYRTDSWRGIFLLTIRDLIFVVLIGIGVFVLLHFTDL